MQSEGLFKGMKGYSEWFIVHESVKIAISKVYVDFIIHFLINLK